MSKQKRGMFRRMIDTARKAVGLPVTHKYTDPAFRDPRTRKKKRSHASSSGRFAVERIKLSAPPHCRPGTISYHDKLVRHFGARFANDFRRRYIASVRLIDRVPLVLPTAQDFADNPPWSFLK